MTMTPLISSFYTVVDLTPPATTITSPELTLPISHLFNDVTMTTNTVWRSDVYKVESQIDIKARSNTSFSEQVDATCSVYNETNISYSLIGQVPEWVQFNTQTLALALSGTPPQTEEDEVYSFGLYTSWVDFPQGNTTATVVIQVEGVEQEKDEQTTAGKVAEVVQVVQVGVLAAGLVTTAAFTGAPPTALWIVLNQVRIILLLMFIDDYAPTDIKQYMGMMNFAFFNFKFLQTRNAPGIRWCLDWIDYEKSDEKVSYLDLDSKSTIVNCSSIILVLFILISFHLFLTPFK